ncbi:Protein of unknown function, partial [Gryllus bimaculatus]
MLYSKRRNSLSLGYEILNVFPMLRNTNASDVEIIASMILDGANVGMVIAMTVPMAQEANLSSGCVAWQTELDVLLASQVAKAAHVAPGASSQQNECKACVQQRIHYANSYGHHVCVSCAVKTKNLGSSYVVHIDCLARQQDCLLEETHENIDKGSRNCVRR